MLTPTGQAGCRADSSHEARCIFQDSCRPPWTVRSKSEGASESMSKSRAIKRLDRRRPHTLKCPSQSAPRSWSARARCLLRRPRPCTRRPQIISCARSSPHPHDACVVCLRLREGSCLRKLLPRCRHCHLLVPHLTEQGMHHAGRSCQHPLHALCTHNNPQRTVRNSSRTPLPHHYNKRTRTRTSRMSSSYRQRRRPWS